jgi:hypothetical protein
MDFTNNNTSFAPLIGMGQSWHGIMAYLNGLRAIPVDHAAFTEKYGSWSNEEEVTQFLTPLSKISDFSYLICDTTPTGQDLPDPVPDITVPAPQNMFAHFVWCTLRLEALSKRFIAVYADINSGNESPSQIRAQLTDAHTGLIAQCQQQQADNEQLRQKLLFVAPHLREQLTDLHNTTVFNYAYQAVALFKRKVEIADADIKELKEKILILHRTEKIAALEAEKEGYLQEITKKELFLADVDGFSIANFNNISAFDLLTSYAQSIDNWFKTTIAMLERVGSLDDNHLSNHNQLVANLDIQNMSDRWNIIMNSGKTSIKTALSI